ncbi:hypothetical protein HU200_049735 [Digitaria exilis]|uniref:Uncharacterized protein n=1 Tax=Digitaria exilis TaxID=1010633 RepID=A0A835E877_9POAL|nr:hypothetical protein HU200_049735 [Digitaria exilis]
MDGGTVPGAEVLSPGEAEWPPELRLPPLPPSAMVSQRLPAPHLKLTAPAATPPKKEPSPPRHAEGGFDDQQFLGSMMGGAAPHQHHHHHQQQQTAASQQQQQQHHHHHQQQPPADPAPVKRKRGRPPKNRDATTQAAVPAPVRPVNKKEEEVVCFICFDGGDLVVCDRRGCPKVYHPACIKRDESFFRSRGKWDCGCIKQGKFFGVRGNKGFCDMCYGTILLIESKDDGAKVGVDFDDKNSWEYLFKLYWLDLKGKHLLTMSELFDAKRRWTVPTTVCRREKEESSDELYDVNDDQDASFDISSRKRRRNNLSGKRGQKRKKDSGVIKKAPALNADSQKAIDSDSAEVGSDKRRKAQKNIQVEQTTNLEDYAAIDMHNINLIYLRRSLMEDLIDDDASFSDKIAGAFVRIRISGLGNKQDMYRLVKVLGTHKVADRYNVGKKTTDYALLIANLDKKEVITMDTISNQDFTECVEKLQLLDTPEEKARRINEVPEVHVDPRMTPNYESAEEQDYKKAGTVSTRTFCCSIMCSGRKGAESNSVPNHTKKYLDASGCTSTAPTEDVGHPTEAGSNMTSNNTTVEPIMPVVASDDTEPEKVWHYKDPKGAVQGPFTLLQLSKWVNFFPRDMRIWLTFESEKNSLLLSEVLSKQQSDFVEPPAATASDKSIWAGMGKDRINSIADISSSPVGYNAVYSSALSSQFAEVSDPTKEDPKHWSTALPSRSLKKAHSLHGQVQHQVNYSSTTIQSSVGSYAQTGSHDERVPREQVGEWKSCQDNAGTRSATIAPINHSCKSNMEKFPDGCTTKDQLQADSKSHFHSVPVLTPQQSGRDPAAPLSTTSLPEFKAMCQQKPSYWGSAINAGAHDPQLSVASVKPESRSPTNPFEDRDSRTVSAVSSQSGAPAYLPQPVPSLSTSNSSKVAATINQHKACRPAASNTTFDKDPEPKNVPMVSLKTQDVECEKPSPTPKLERKETPMNQSRSPEDLATKPCVHSSVSSVSEPSGSPASKIDSLQSVKEKSCLEGRHLIDGDSMTQMEHLLENTVNGNNKSVNHVSDAEGIAVSDVFESLTEQNCERYSIPEAMPLENFVAPSAEEEQPQCSSPIALSPWGEPSYYQGEAVDSALWDVQDDPGNDMWSMPSPTPALQPSSG